MNEPMRWYNSIAVKCCLVAFVTTHIPLLGLIAVVVLRPDWLTPWSVLFAALVFTLAATGVVVAVFWRMFGPLREAADGLRGFMTRGLVLQATAGSTDEIGRLVQVLVRSLAHLDRSRSPLLQRSAFTLSQALPQDLEPRPRRDGRWLALVEVDQWDSLERAADVVEMARVHAETEASLDALLQPEEAALPWGRGRFLLVLAGSGADAHERLGPVCRQLPVRGDRSYTATAAVEPQDVTSKVWAAALQRLDHKLFGLRLDGRQAAAY